MYEVVKGIPEASIAGAPFPLIVSPNEASAAWSTAYGRGLVQGVAGEEASFTIIAKDAWGNTRFDGDAESHFRVLAFVEMTTPGPRGWSRENSGGLVAATATPGPPALTTHLSMLSETSVCSASGGSDVQRSASGGSLEEEQSPTEATPLSPLKPVKPAARSAHR